MRPAQFLLLAFVLAALAKVLHSYKQRRMAPQELLFLGPGVDWHGGDHPLSQRHVLPRHLLGIGWGADLIMYVSLLISFYLIFRLYVALARLEQGITALVRALALERFPESVDSRTGHGD